MKTKKHSLAQSRRSDLVNAICHRGKKLSNIWMVYSAIRDQEVVLVGDLRVEHFYACEGDPTIRTVEYRPEPVLIGSPPQTVQFDAVVRFADGHSECHDVTYFPLSAKDDAVARMTLGQRVAAAATIAASYREITTDELDAYHMRIQNWGRALQFVAQCRRRPLEFIEFSVVARVRSHGEASLG
ncbi:MAG TPA: hypothetical protein VGV14_17845 [Rhodanobacter sp.]|nr:hypothetical protein [Rhodanobacter sp.]